MTTLERWHDVRGDGFVFEVNGAVRAVITPQAVYGASRYVASVEAFARLTAMAVAPLIWLAMPTHEDGPAHA